jgi:hypothetical protein
MKKYLTFELDDDEDPDPKLNELSTENWRLITVTPFIEKNYDNRGYEDNTRKIRYVMKTTTGD